MNGNTPIRVLIAGCAYGGIATVVNLLDLCLGKSPRGSPNEVPCEAALKGIEVDIHIVDERDGYRTCDEATLCETDADVYDSPFDRMSIGFRL